MDVERTIEFLLKSQAKHDAQIEGLLAAQAKAEARSDAMEKRFEKRMNGITKLIQLGMKMLVRIEKRVDGLATRMEEIAVAHKELA